jgi:hypothetical protein
MNIENRKKLATIKKKVIGSMWVEMSKSSRGKKVDTEYSGSLKLLADAIKGIEYQYGDLD